jgi:DNA-binding transcriptional regulator YdaS (Cro superfamily)
MTKDELIQHFGSQSAVAAALGIKQPSVANWTDPLPELRQLEVERLTGGKLRAGMECDKYRVDVKPEAEAA